MMQCLLDQRAIVAVGGEDAESFLNRLLTRSTLAMRPGDARYGALLSPQGKILVDFLIDRVVEGFWLDCPASLAQDLVKRLAMFRLRAKVTVALAGEMSVMARWDAACAPDDLVAAMHFRDPRHQGLGWRIVGPRRDLPPANADFSAYDAHRIALGVPTGGIDSVFGDGFVHDANIDLLGGVDFEKGCYVGQEVVSRVHHRKSARKRIVRLRFHGDPPSIGAAITAGALQIGQVTSIAGLDGLASVRIDRLAEAEAMHSPVIAGETLVTVTLPPLEETDALADAAIDLA